MNKLLPLSLLGFLLASCQTQSPEEVTSEPENKAVAVAPLNMEGKEVSFFTTASNTDLRLSPGESSQFGPVEQARENEVTIFVNPRKKFQKFIGIGAAITDASAEVFAKLPAEQQEKLLESYYDPSKGIGYTLVRTSIHSCDFSSGSFTYVSDEDPELKTFDISHDREFRIPMLKRAFEKAGGSLLFYASPWSPPPFMKSNGDMLQGGSLLPDFYESWALYYTKFIKAYEAEGFPVWGITIQNEPMAVQRWESCIYTAEQERDFLKNYLGPVMEREGLGDKKIVVWDHNRDLLSERANVIFEDPEAAKYAWGIGFHWYETWAGGEPMFQNLANTKESFPDKQLLFTEGCNERFDSSKYQFWPNAERYGRSMINDFNAGTVGWTDWNILLDQTGGPNHVGNLCFAPVHADVRSGELIYTPSYYYLGHFSKFIRPGAKRISTTSSRSLLMACSFENPDGTTATVVMNPTDMDIDFRLSIEDQGVSSRLPAHSIQTILY